MKHETESNISCETFRLHHHIKLTAFFKKPEAPTLWPNSGQFWVQVMANLMNEIWSLRPHSGVGQGHIWQHWRTPYLCPLHNNKTKKAQAKPQPQTKWILEHIKHLLYYNANSVFGFSHLAREAAETQLMILNKWKIIKKPVTRKHQLADTASVYIITQFDL